MKHTTHFVSLGKEMHHCSSICKHDKGYIMACYHGRECTDKQRVAVCFAKNPGEIDHFVDLENKTGNPVVWSFMDKTFMIHSIFSDVNSDGVEINYGNALVKRWMNCENFLSEIEVKNNKIKITNTKKIEGAYGLLARCQPLVEDNRVIIPLYREENPLCEVWEFDGTDLKKIGEFGHVTDDVIRIMKDKTIDYGSLGKGVAIQPSIIKKNGLYHAVCRNVCRPNNSHAWMCSSPDCKSWSGLKLTGIPNHNNSIVSIQDDENDIFVFSTNGRRDMLLYNNTTKKHAPLHHIITTGSRPSFSYPNYLLNDGELHVVHTNCKVIAWHVFDKDYIENFRQT